MFVWHHLKFLLGYYATIVLNHFDTHHKLQMVPFSLMLRVRFHYGHPDVFDRIFHITRGGISKSSRGINLSEDIFAGETLTIYLNIC